MEADDTSAVGPIGRCCLCHRILSSEIETQGSLASTRICDNCNHLFLDEQTRYNESLESIEDMLSQQIQDLQPTRQWTRVPSEPESGSYDSDASVVVDAFVNHNHDDDDNDDDDNDDDGSDGDDEIEGVVNRVGSLVGRIQLHRSLATNGRNRPDDWLSEILSNEGIQNSERRRLFGILEDQVLETLRYGDRVDVETHGLRLGSPPAADWFVKNLERVVVDETGSVCVICKDNVGVGGVVNRLPCGHVYHPSCIVPWLNARSTCPLCRYELPTDDKDRSRDSEVEVQGELAESGGGRWRFVVIPIVSVVGIVVVFWLRGVVFGGQRDDRSTRLWSLFVNE